MGDDSSIVLATHALVWWLTGAPSLSRVAKQTIAKAVEARQVVVSAKKWTGIQPTGSSLHLPFHYGCGVVTADEKLRAVRALKTVW